MNKKQKAVLIIATLIIVGICLNPPSGGGEGDSFWGKSSSSVIIFGTILSLFAIFTSAISCIYLLKSNGKSKEKSTITQK